jgi:hypothetical protein
MNQRLATLGLSLFALACGTAPTPSITCGDGTRLDGTRCVSTLTPVECAPGTRLEGNACVSTIAPVACAAGTHLEAGRCVVDAVACAAGTHLEVDRCVVDPPPEIRTSWGANVRVCAEGVECLEPQLALASDGTLYVAYTTLVNGGAQYAIGLAVSTDDGATFTERKRFTGADGYAYSPTLAVDSTGAVLLAWNDYHPGASQQDYGTGEIYLAVSTDQGQTWSTAQPVSGPPSGSLHYRPWLSADAQGVDLVWQRYEAQDSTMLIARTVDHGTTFTIPALVPTEAGTYDYTTPRGPSARLASGEFLLPYQRLGYDLTNGGYLSQVGVQTLQQDAQGAVTSMGGLDVKRLFYTRDLQLDPMPSLAAGGTRRCLAFLDAPSRDADVYVMTADGPFTSDQRPHEVPGGTGTTQFAPKAQLDAQGRCHVTWLDNRSGQWELWSLQVLADGSLATPERVSDVAFPEDGVKKQLSDVTGLVLGATHRFAAWTDTRDGAQSVYLSRAPLAGLAPGH